MAVRKKVTKKKVGKKKAVARRNTGTAMATGNWESALETSVAKTSEMLKGAGGNLFISTKGGRFTFDGATLEEPLPVIILDTILENQYYEGVYDSDNPSTPVCFALGTEKDDMVPDPTSPAPQAEACAECWANKWKSADTGRGKACKNTVRLALLPAPSIDAEELSEVEFALMRLPVTSTPNLKGYSDKIKGALSRPLFGVVTDLEIEENEKTQYEVTFTLNESIGDAATGEVILGQIDACQEALTSVPEPQDKAEEVEKPVRRRTTKKKATKKKAAKKKAGRRKF